MRLLGVERVEQLNPQHVRLLYHYLYHGYRLTVQVNTRLLEQQIYDGPSGIEPLREFRAKL